MNSEKYIGLDVHQATISVAVLDSTGKLVMESILETKAATILEFAERVGGWSRDCDNARYSALDGNPEASDDPAKISVARVIVAITGER